MNIELNLRDGNSIDRAERFLAHAIALVNDDYDEAKKMARQDRDTALERFAHLTGSALSFAVVRYLNKSRDQLPV